MGYIPQDDEFDPDAVVRAFAPAAFETAPTVKGVGWWTPDRINQAVTHLQDKAGLSPMGARGLVARWAGVEAKGGPNSVNPSNGATGIAQWLGTRKNGVPSDFVGQLNHVAKELNSTESAAARRLRNAQTPEEAATGAAMYERAEGYNPKTGRDNFVAPTIRTLKQIGGPSAPAFDPNEVVKAFTPTDFDPNSVVAAFTPDVPQAPVSPTNPVNAPAPPTTAPVTAPETPLTIQQQIQSALNPNSPKAAVLLTDPGQLGQIGGAVLNQFTPIAVPEGTLLVNQRAAWKMGLKTPDAIKQRVAKKGFNDLIGNVTNAPTDGSVPAVTAVDGQGNELHSSAVTSPQEAQDQAALNHQMYPGSATIPTTKDEIVANRGEQPVDLLQPEATYPNKTLADLGQMMSVPNNIAGGTPSGAAETSKPPLRTAQPPATPPVTPQAPETPVSPVTDADYQQYVDAVGKYMTPMSREEFDQAAASAPKGSVTATARTGNPIVDNQEVQGDQEQPTPDGGAVRYPRVVGTPSSKDGVAGVYRYPAGMSKEDAAKNAFLNVARPYGGTEDDYAKFLKKNPDWGLKNYAQGQPGEVNVTFSALKDAGLDVDTQRRMEEAQNLQITPSMGIQGDTRSAIQALQGASNADVINEALQNDPNYGIATQRIMGGSSNPPTDEQQKAITDEYARLQQRDKDVTVNADLTKADAEWVKNGLKSADDFIWNLAGEKDANGNPPKGGFFQDIVGSGVGGFVKGSNSLVGAGIGIPLRLAGMPDTALGQWAKDNVTKAEVFNSSVSKDSVGGKIANGLGAMIPQLPLIAMSMGVGAAAGLGEIGSMIVGFAAPAVAQAYGEGQSLKNVAETGANSVLDALIFHGAAKASKFLVEGADAALFRKANSLSDIAAIENGTATPSQLSRTLLNTYGTASELGSVASGVYLKNKVMGREDAAEDALVQTGIIGILKMLHVPAKNGKEGKLDLKSAAGEVFDIEGKDPHYITITPEGKVVELAKKPERASVVIVPKAFKDYAAKDAEIQQGVKLDEARQTVKDALGKEETAAETPVEKPAEPALESSAMPEKGNNQTNQVYSDEKGSPVTFFHSTKSKEGTEITASSARQFGKGVYFASDPTTVTGGDFGHRTLAAHLPDNLLDAGSKEFSRLRAQVENESGIDYYEPNFPIQKLNDLVRGRGYKGIIHEHPEYGQEAVIFNPKDIKWQSATETTQAPAPSEASTPAEGAKEGGQVKEPWEMTKKEWDALPLKEQVVIHQQHENTLPEKYRNGGAGPSNTNYHIIRVLSALNQGKDVPRPVLDEIEHPSYHATKILEDIANKDATYPATTIKWAKDNVRPKEQAAIEQKAQEKKQRDLEGYRNAPEDQLQKIIEEPLLSERAKQMARDELARRQPSNAPKFTNGTYTGTLSPDGKYIEYETGSGTRKAKVGGKWRPVDSVENPAEKVSIVKAPKGSSKVQEQLKTKEGIDKIYSGIDENADSHNYLTTSNQLAKIDHLIKAENDPVEKSRLQERRKEVEANHKIATKQYSADLKKRSDTEKATVKRWERDATKASTEQLQSFAKDLESIPRGDLGYARERKLRIVRAELDRRQPTPKPPPEQTAETGAKGRNDKVDTIAGSFTYPEFEQREYEPHEVTRQNWIDLQRANRRSLGQSEESGTKAAPYADYEGFHEQSVRDAIKRNQEIDERVLADYPDLKEQAAKPIDEANPLRSIINDKGINYDNAKDVAGRIRDGSLEVTRLDRQGERGRLAGGERALEASVLLGADEQRRQEASQGSGSKVESRSDTQARQENLLENYAKREGIWYDWNKFFRNKHFTRGGEAFVYRQGDNDVAKTFDYRHIDKGLTPQEFLDNRIALYNHIFPETPYTLMGFTKDPNGKFRFLVKQPFIDAHGVSQADVQDLMASKGFTKTGRESYTNGLYNVFDVHEKNALQDPKGNKYVIDAVPKLAKDEHYQPFAVTAKTPEPPAKEQAASESSPVERAEYGTKNALVTKEQADEAADTLKKALRDSTRTANAGLPLDPKVLSAAVKVAAYHVEAGARASADFAARMVEEFGDAIKPHLEQIYKAVRDQYKFEGMDEKYGETKQSLEPTDIKPVIGKGVVGGENPPAQTEPAPERGTSKIGKSIEQKAIDAGLTEGFPETAGYDKKNVQDQIDRIQKLVDDDPENARAIALGVKPVPPGISPIMMVRAFEEIADKTNDNQLRSDLANSPLVSESSIHAQEMRMMRERTPDSATALIQEIRQARAAKIQKLLRGRTVDQALADEAANISKSVVSAKRAATSRMKWNEFLDSIQC